MKITYCLSPLAKLKGLLGKRNLAEHHCYVFAPCKAIHTFGMRFAIDVIFCDKTGHLLKYYRQLAPNRIVFVSRAFFTIELASKELLDAEQLQQTIAACLAFDSDNKNHINWI
jgi:hypothetical protein